MRKEGKVGCGTCAGLCTDRLGPTVLGWSCGAHGDGSPTNAMRTRRARDPGGILPTFRVSYSRSGFWAMCGRGKRLGVLGLTSMVLKRGRGGCPTVAEICVWGRCSGDVLDCGVVAMMDSCLRNLLDCCIATGRSCGIAVIRIWRLVTASLVLGLTGVRDTVERKTGLSGVLQRWCFQFQPVLSNCQVT